MRSFIVAMGQFARYKSRTFVKGCSYAQNRNTLRVLDDDSRSKLFSFFAQTFTRVPRVAHKALAQFLGRPFDFTRTSFRNFRSHMQERVSTTYAARAAGRILRQAGLDVLLGFAVACFLTAMIVVLEVIYWNYTR